jgi:hypothetical protein
MFLMRRIAYGWFLSLWKCGMIKQVHLDLSIFLYISHLKEHPKNTVQFNEKIRWRTFKHVYHYYNLHLIRYNGFKRMLTQNTWSIQIYEMPLGPLNYSLTFLRQQPI